MKLKTSAFTLKGLIEHIEENVEDERDYSNNWEGKFDINRLKELLKDSLFILDGTAYVALQNGLFAIDLEKGEIPPAMDSIILLFEVDGFYEVSKEIIKKRIDLKQSELVSLQILNTYFVKEQ